jgi:hypothetical protein
MDEHERDEALPALSLGDHVSDCDGEGERMVVVGISATRADDYSLGDEGADGPAGGDVTVADLNIDYRSDDAVIHVVYQQHGLELDLDKTYAFPRSRLRLEQPLTD